MLRLAGVASAALALTSAAPIERAPVVVTPPGSTTEHAVHAVQRVQVECRADGSSARIGLLAQGVQPLRSPAVEDAVSDRRRRWIERRIDSRLAEARPRAGVRAAVPPPREGLTTRLRAGRSDLTVRVPVHVHVVDGHGADDEPGPGPRAVQRQIDVLNQAFAGGQSDRSATAPFRFHLASYERVVRTGWHRAAPDSRAERRMKLALGGGSLDELDLFVTEPQIDDGSIALGSASFPWEGERSPAADGVVLHSASLPGGDARGYGRGDSAVHEVGHWLGLFHTFEGGCGSSGDMVADTPREAAPSFGCERGRDSCPSAKGDDPVHNFMDYSLDRCMDRFTPGQVERMSRSWLAFRAR